MEIKEWEREREGGGITKNKNNNLDMGGEKKELK